MRIYSSLKLVEAIHRTVGGSYLLRNVDGEEREPPPVFPVLFPQVVEPPVFSSAPLPIFPPEVVMSQPNTPNPCQDHDNHGSPLVVLPQRMRREVVNQHYRYHSPIHIDHLQKKKTFLERLNIKTLRNGFCFRGN